jgi:NAD+ kinase
MALPIDLVLIRHGQSEGNAAKRRSEQGDHAALKKLQEQHTRSVRLSKLGREQASAAGRWLVNEFYSDSKGFDSFYTSEFVRAMETAALLGLPNARWFRSFYLAERDWGDLESCPEDERAAKYGEAMRMRGVEPFFWRPPNGESMAEVCLRLDRVLQTLHRENSEKRVIIVCHGEVMRAFRILLERMPQQRFKELSFSKEREDGVYNCEIMHYTRRDPQAKTGTDYADWMRRVRPLDTPVWTTGWQQIERPRYTNEDLLGIVSQSQTVLE